MLRLFAFIVSYTAITLLWGAYELLVLGEIKPDFFDTVITVVLSISLAMNVTD